MGYEDYVSFDAEDMERHDTERRCVGVTCRRCGCVGLQWKKLGNGKFRLCDSSRQLHVCSPNKGA